MFPRISPCIAVHSSGFGAPPLFVLYTLLACLLLSPGGLSGIAATRTQRRRDEPGTMEVVEPVTTPQEPTAPRIVQFRQRRNARSRAGIMSSTDAAQWSPSASGQDTAADRLLEVSTIADPMPGEQAGVSHLRAVHLGASSGAFYPHTPTERVPLVAGRMGISSIEIMLQTHGEYDPAFIAQARALSLIHI